MNAKRGGPSEVAECSGSENASVTGGKVTIVVVHGTFASPHDHTGGGDGRPRPPEWYRPGGSFCMLLDAVLAKLGSSTRTWKHLGDSREEFFWWSGDNSWHARSDAAERLAAYLRRLAARGWTCHLIAHSHGGNVVIEAIRKLRWLEGSGNRALGQVCLLGTPIYTLPSPRSWVRRALEAASVIALIAAVLLHDLTSPPRPWSV